MPAVIRTPLAAIFVLSVLVFIHELGHYLAARWRGVHVEVFSIGFGKPIVTWHDRVGTEWRLCWLLLGGFVKPHGFEVAADASPEVRASWQPGRTFHDKPVGSRAIVIAAGPAFNFILAILLLTGVFAIAGRPVEVQKLSDVPPVVGEVSADSAASRAGLHPRDRIEALDGTAVASFDALQKQVLAHGGQSVTLRVLRDGQTMEVPAVLGGTQGAGRLGIAASLVSRTEHLSLPRAFVAGTAATWRITQGTAAGLWQMLTGRVAASEVGGPLRIAQMSGQFAAAGWVSLLTFMAILSVNLGLINLVPLPILDGGRLLFYAVEALLGRPIPRRIQEASFRAAFALIACLFLFVTVNDVTQLNLFGWLRGLAG
ncbi:RIP metalloprotease RseP [Rhizosaccharibacter radicis]|uniref:Zinc metalloprotease n=1 Tax=Rhizosaccharibacter radicis TaxID=2782605 RepID=A0ABT1VVB3_9PROT|nr:RIP metalloprotease RseP [Acetobacteraceae bacterium KSS12]